jgi:hypothetical protein
MAANSMDEGMQMRITTTSRADTNAWMYHFKNVSALRQGF